MTGTPDELLHSAPPGLNTAATAQQIAAVRALYGAAHLRANKAAKMVQIIKTIAASGYVKQGPGASENFGPLNRWRERSQSLHDVVVDVEQAGEEGSERRYQALLVYHFIDPWRPGKVLAKSPKVADMSDALQHLIWQMSYLEGQGNMWEFCGEVEPDGAEATAAAAAA